jgi:hypothetical protein
MPSQTSTVPYVTYRNFYSLNDLNYAANKLDYFAYQSGQLEVLSNNSKQDTTSARIEVFNLPQLSGPRDIATFTMTEYYTLYTNFGTLTFQDVKIGTNTTIVNISTTYGNFATDRKDDLITLKRTLTYDSEGNINGMNLDMLVPTIE